MSKQNFTGFLVALVVAAAPYIALVVGTAIAPEPRGNPAVTEEVYKDSQATAPASPSHLRHAVA